MIEELSRQEVIEFIHQHKDDDPTKLVLAKSKYKNIPVRLAVEQIQSRKKAKKKLPEWYSTLGVLFPHGTPIEQCSSEIAARYKANLIHGRSLVDLTGGTGVDTFYLSEKFENTTYIEQNPVLCELANHNFGILNRSINIINCQAEEYLKKLDEPIDWFYVDPARRDENNKKVYRIGDCTPALNELQQSLRKLSKGILIKYSPLLDISEIIRTLDHVTEIHIVSINNDCKELLVLISGNSTDTQLCTINFQKECVQRFSFGLDDETQSTPRFSLPKKILYEPNSSILKAGAFKVLAKEFNVEKLHINSHLYTSEKLIDGFPGRSFEVLGVEPLKKAMLKTYCHNDKANITTRNFPLTIDQIKKKAGIKDGGDIYIFATTLVTGKPRLVICKKT